MDDLNMQPGVADAGEELSRQAELDMLRIMDSPAEPGFDEIVELAARLCQTPIALVSLVDADKQWFMVQGPGWFGGD